MPRIETLKVSAYSISTDGPESDGTLEWKGTTLVLVEIGAGGTTGLGYTDADTAPARCRSLRGGASMWGTDALDLAILARLRLRRRIQRQLDSRLI